MHVIAMAPPPLQDSARLDVAEGLRAWLTLFKGAYDICGMGHAAISTCERLVANIIAAKE